MRPRVAVGAIVRDEDGRLLVVKRANPPAQGRWTVPGGHVEGGEQLRDAVQREVAEETGLQVRVTALAGVTERIGGGHHHVIIDFHAEVIGGTAAAATDAADLAWTTRSELVAAGPTEGLLDFLDEHGIAIAE